MGPAWGPSGATGPRWAQCWPHERFYQGWSSTMQTKALDMLVFKFHGSLICFIFIFLSNNVDRITYTLSSVCLRLSKFSQLSFMQYMELCVFSLSIYLMTIVRIHVLYLIIIVKLKLWPISHCLGLGHETIVYAVCLSIFLAMILPSLSGIF